MMGKITIISGHYGCGKTNFAINMAINLSKKEKVTLVDMDLVNPYFRSSDYRNILGEHDIDVIAPVYAGTNVDIPSLPEDIYTIFAKEGHIVIDLGGDDAGATVLGRFFTNFSDADYEMLYVVNKYRNLIAEPEDAVQILREIECATRLKATAIVNNSHLKQLTKLETITEAYEYGKKVSESAKLPLLYTTVPHDLYEELLAIDNMSDIYPVDIYVKTVWE